MMTASTQTAAPGGTVEANQLLSSRSAWWTSSVLPRRNGGSFSSAT